MSNMTPEQQQMEREWRDSYKPAWGPGETLLYAIPGKVGSSSNKSAQADPILQKLEGFIVSEGRDIRFAKFAKTPNVSASCFRVNTIHADQTLSSFQQFSHSNKLAPSSPLNAEYRWRSFNRPRSKTLRHSSSHLRSMSNLFGSSRPFCLMIRTQKPMVCPQLIKPPTTIASAKTA